jgi:hypothetical protein
LAKKKKKEKKEKKKKVEEEVDKFKNLEEYSLDDALRSTKTTETTLQSLVKEVSEGKGFVLPKKEDDEKITPQLSHESRTKIAEAYALEDIPLIQRKSSEKSQRTRLVPETKKELTTSKPTKKKQKGKPRVAPSKSDKKAERKPKSKEIAKPSSEPKVPTKVPAESKATKPPKIQVEISTVPTKGEEKEVAPAPPEKVVKKENIYLKLTDFFEELLTGYNERYERWENSISNILGILRKMRKITKKNTDDLVVSINNLYKKIKVELELFKIKRNEVEKVAEVDIESMSGEFKRVLGLLELQIKEYQLKRVADELIHEMQFLS